MSTAPKAQSQDKFAVDKVTTGGMTVLTMQGTLNDAFEGRKLAEGIKTKKVIVGMRDVRRFASWGMSEWMDFLRINAERDLYLVECSTYAVSQINLVTGLLGHAKLVSFYASYRCGSCSEELETLFVIPRDRDMIRVLPTSHQDCATCGGRARLEEYPAAFFETIADRDSFDIDDEVLGLFRTQLGYDLAPDLTRFRAFRAVSAGYSYLRLSGSLSLLPANVLANASEGTAILDLEGVIYDPSQSTPWRSYLQLATAKVKALQLLNCPPGFLETAIEPHDFHDKLKIRTFGLAYDCLRCETTTSHMVDVAENLEQLVGGAAPTARCPACKALLVAALTHDQISRFRALPARDRDPNLDKFLLKARAEPQDRLENCLVAAAAKKPIAPANNGRVIYLALVLGTLLVAGLGMVAWKLWSAPAEEKKVIVNTPVADAAPVKPTFTRPEWIMSGVPSSGYCHDVINRLMCVGVSSYRPTRDEAVAEASDAALDELVNAVSLKITDPYVRENVIPLYGDVRAKALLALQTADIDRTSAEYTAAEDVVRKARKRVVEALYSSGGSAVPTQRSDWYWEEYAGEKNKANEILVFVRYDITLDAVRTLVEKYSANTSVLSNRVLTAFPGLGWPFADFTGGAIVTKASGQLGRAGIAVPFLVMAIGEQRIIDASAFARRLEEAQTTKTFKLTVKAGETPTQVIEVRR